MPKVKYLNYEAVEDKGWSIDDSDLFEKAEGEDLSSGNSRYSKMNIYLRQLREKDLTGLSHAARVPALTVQQS